MDKSMKILKGVGIVGVALGSVIMWIIQNIWSK
jgi:uncharacterized protein YjeT (DUF2065 family)